MNTQDAAYSTGHEYPGGVTALAARMGVSRNVLQNKLNPAIEYHKLTLSEAMAIQALTGDARILHAMASELGYVCIKLPDSDASDMELLDSFMAVVKELGDFSNEFRQGWADGKIDRKELTRLRKEFYEMQAAGTELMARIEHLAEQSHG